MNFRRGSQTEELEINFIPLIDVLLVIIIFLVVSTTFSKFSELKINLPVAEANPQEKLNNQIDIVITQSNEYTINEKKLPDNSIKAIQQELTRIKSETSSDNPITVVINADALSNHQSVINVMEASRISGLTKVTFLTKTK
ncbi:MAG: biopolymer transporter ExbD [Nitrosomonadales bacterium]